MPILVVKYFLNCSENLPLCDSCRRAPGGRGVRPALPQGPQVPAAQPQAFSGGAPGSVRGHVGNCPIRGRRSGTTTALLGRPCVIAQSACKSTLLSLLRNEFRYFLKLSFPPSDWRPNRSTEEAKLVSTMERLKSACRFDCGRYFQPGIEQRQTLFPGGYIGRNMCERNGLDK
jgi:hypothetical protein